MKDDDLAPDEVAQEKKLSPQFRGEVCDCQAVQKSH